MVFHTNRHPATGKNERMDRQSLALTERIFAQGEKETMQVN